MLNCRRCQSAALLRLARLGRNDHTVYRCRACGFLFSPPDFGPSDGDGNGNGVIGDDAGISGSGGAGHPGLAPASSPADIIPSDIIPAAPPLSAGDIRLRQRDADAVYPQPHTRRPAGR